MKNRLEDLYNMSEDVRPDGEVNNLEDMIAQVQAARKLQLDSMKLLGWLEISELAKLVLQYMSFAHRAVAQRKCTLQFLDASLARLPEYRLALEAPALLPEGTSCEGWSPVDEDLRLSFRYLEPADAEEGAIFGREWGLCIFSDVFWKLVSQAGRDDRKKALVTLMVNILMAVPSNGVELLMKPILLPITRALRAMKAILCPEPCDVDLEDVCYILPKHYTQCLITSEIPLHGKSLNSALRKDRAGLWMDGKKDFEQTIGPMMMYRGDYFTVEALVGRMEATDDCVELASELVIVFEALDNLATEAEASLRKGALLKIKSRVTDKAKVVFKWSEEKGCTEETLKLLRCFADFGGHGHFTSNTLKTRISDVLLNWQSASGALAIGAAVTDTVKGGRVHIHDLERMCANLEGEHVPEDAGSLVEVAFMITRQLVNCPRVDHKFLVLVKHDYIFFSSPFVMRSDESSIGLGDPTCRADELQETIAIRRVEQ